MKSPIGVDIEVGQRWREVDARFERFVWVTDLNYKESKVKIGRRWAKLSRFNGKRSGYAPAFEIKLPF